MSEEYFREAGLGEARRAFALDCIVKLLGTAPSEKLTQGRGGIAERIIERAEVFEIYLRG